jgi:hypothetical protein
MAPEQLEHPQDVDQRADVYSLGVVFYEMLTGELPIGRFAPPSQKSAVDPRVDEVVLHALEKERERRYRSVGEVKTSVEAITAQSAKKPADPLATGPDSGSGRGERARQVLASFRGIPGLWLAVLMLLLGGFGGYLFSRAGGGVFAKRSGSGSANRLVLDAVPPQYVPGGRDPRESGGAAWSFKCLVPPDHLARIVFVVRSNNAPVIDPRLGAYFKVGHKPVVLDWYIDCEPLKLPTDPEQARLIRERIGLAGTNVLQWNMSLGLGYTASALRPAEPAFRPLAAPAEMSVRSGHQRVIPLLEYPERGAASAPSRSGVELHVMLEPLRSPAIRTAPLEKDLGDFIGGSGLDATVEEALKLVRRLPSGQ